MSTHSSRGGNIRKTWIILALFIIFATTLGFVIGKLFNQGVLVAEIVLPVSLILVIIVFFFADTFILGFLKAKKVKEAANTPIYQLVTEIAGQINLPVPTLYYIEDQAANIASLGRTPKSAKLILTTGLATLLSRPEMEAVVSHEFSHIQEYDTRVNAVASLIIGYLPTTLVFYALSPLFAPLMHLAVSPKRELAADAAAALKTRYPAGLAEALRKLAESPHPVKSATNATTHLFIVNPLLGKAPKSTFTSLFNTHPATEERIKILQSM